ncbi:diguanylate cyclase domain-containing protein [Neptuniibacter caesariensis]|nr:diguanylate cyclase [Neptuniibacter caesariensis]
MNKLLPSMETVAATNSAASRRQRIKLTLTVAICAFLVLDCTILGLNFYITRLVEQDALAINISGRQRMLSQRMAKSLLHIAVDQSYSEQGSLELNAVYPLFIATLSAIKEGGEVTDGEGNLKPFSAIHDAKVRQYIIETEAVMKLVSPVIENYLNRPNPDSLSEAIDKLNQHNLTLLSLMNKLTYRIEQLSQEKTSSLRWIQSLAFALALLNFLLIVRLFHQRSIRAEFQVKNFLNLVDGAATSLIVLNHKRRIILANKMSRDFFGYSERRFRSISESELFSKTGADLCAVTRSGEMISVEVKERQYDLDDRVYTILTINDISHFTKAQSILAHQANHDPLTGLVNRRAVHDRLELELLRAKRFSTMLGVLFIDLDRFKPVNDSLGHAVGDEVLGLCAQRLKGVVRSSDTVARYGGDEFVVLLPDIDKDSMALVVKQMVEAISESYHVGGDQIDLGCSIGQALYPEDGNNAISLLEVSDKRMYEYKRSLVGK